MSCGGQALPRNNAVYCSQGDFIAYDVNWSVAAFRQVGDAFVFYLLGHEYAHGIQVRLGINYRLHHPAGVAGRLHGRGVPRRLGPRRHPDPRRRRPGRVPRRGCSPSATTPTSRGSPRARTAPPSSAPTGSSAATRGPWRPATWADGCQVTSGARPAIGRSGPGWQDRRRPARPLEDPLSSHHPAAVLFDMDGTLVDSEKLWDVALQELGRRVRRRRCPAPPAASMIGTAMAESMRILHDDLGQPERDPQVSAAWINARILELFRTGLRWRPGALTLLRAVRAAGIPTALVTSSRPAAGRGGPGHPGSGQLRRRGRRRRGGWRPSRTPSPT